MKHKWIIVILLITFIIMITSACTEDVRESKTFEEPLLVMYSMRTLVNPYYVQARRGLEHFVSTLGEPTELLAYQHGNSDEQQRNDIKRAIAQSNKKMVALVDSNTIENMYEIAEIFEEAGVYWTSIWTRPDDLHPRDYKYYVAHQSLDNIHAGYTIAKYMFESFETPGKGKVIAINGGINNKASIDRRLGLLKALEEYPEVELLTESYSDWEIGKAKVATEEALENFEGFDGIFVANDGMASAVIDVLSEHKLSGGQVKVVAVDGILIDKIESGDLLATLSAVPWVQGSYGAAIAYEAYKGKIDSEALESSKQVFYTKGELVTKENVRDYKSKWLESELTLTYEDPYTYWFRGQAVEKNEP